MATKRQKNSSADTVTVEVLKDIRNEIRTTNSKLDLLSARVDESNRDLGARIDESNRSLGARIDETNRRLTETEVRLGTAITDMGGTLIEVRDLLRDQLDLRKRVDRIERHLGLE